MQGILYAFAIADRFDGVTINRVQVRQEPHRFTLEVRLRVDPIDHYGSAIWELLIGADVDVRVTVAELIRLAIEDALRGYGSRAPGE